MAWGLQRDRVSKKWNGGLNTCDEQFTNFVFWLSLKQKLLDAYKENKLNGEISTENVCISVNN
jgi:hypothetical protein